MHLHAPFSGPAAPAVSRATALLLSAVLAFGCAASAAYWAMRLGSRPLEPSGAQRQGGALGPDEAARAAPTLFGGGAVAAVSQPARFELVGVIGGGDRAGSAILVESGKSAKAVATGAEVAPGVRLESTTFGGAVLRQDGARTELRVRRAGAAASGPGPGDATSGDEE